MIAFAVGLWVGAAIGACIMGALCAQDRGPIVLTPGLRRASSERILPLHRAAARLQ
jgi:hypothetical protein